MKTIHQIIIFKASPKIIYEIWLDSEKHSALIGDEANISKEINGKFSTFSGYSKGINLELIPNKKIVQTWRANEWAENHYSKITITLTKIKQGTKLEFIQEHVPDKFYESIYKGWMDFYWAPLKEMLKK
jgi:activator of HSP90 ATPase